jgi:hypothetical protein
MSFSFPTSPSVNQLYTFGNKTWKYNGTGWILVTNVDVAQTAWNKANLANVQANTATVLAQGAYNNSNTKFSSSGGTISGSVDITQNLSVTGNLTVLGSATSINTSSFVVNDSLLVLGLGNYTSDVLDIGFASHYNDGQNAHTGIIRDAGTKQWMFFEGYTTEITPNNNIIISDPSFKYANVRVRDLTGNVIANTVSVNGVDLFNYTTNSYTQANTATNNAAGASLYANGSFVQSNAAFGTANSSASYANSAFIQANSGFGIANSASLYANGAFIQSNAAYQSQNTTGTYANSAFGAANTATNNAAGASLYANGAFIQSNASFVTANSAASYANASFIQANASFGTANSGASYANSAFIAANTADSKAVSAGSYANSAFGTANSGASYANSAFLAANTADNKAVTSGSYANSAFTAANTADSKAVSAGSYANSAFTSANTADSKAITAGSYANSAFTVANTATNNAAGASLYANGAFSQANAAYAAANAAGSSATVVAAFIQANSAFGTANSAALYANAAFLAANNASDSWVRGQANAAFIQANAAFAVANSGSGSASSGVYANGAFAQANAAFNKANTLTTTGYVDAFTADGANSSFVLSTTPANKNVTFVAVQGVLQPKSTYSLTGSTLTFDSIPPNTAIIEVTTLVTTIGSNAGGAGNITYRSYTGDNTTSSFTVTSGMTANTIFVAENGILQRPGTDYTVSGTNLSFNTTPSSGVDIQVRELSLGGNVSVAYDAANAASALASSAYAAANTSSITWSIVNTNSTMAARQGYFVDTTTGPITMTLPTSATLGDTIRINDLAGTFSANNLTVARNGHKIQGIANDLLVNVDQSSFGLVYSNSTYGWKVMEL